MPKPFTRSCANGFSLVELLVGMTIALTVVGGAYALAISTRKIYDADATRVRLNQSLRAGMDFLATDIRQAGERLGDDFPAVEIVNGIDGTPDQLIVRRNLLDTVLRLCRDVSEGERDIYIGEPDDLPPPGCAEVPDDDQDDWPQNLQAWREHRLSENGTARAYIYDPEEGQGQFFDYVEESADRLTIRAGSGTHWNQTYRSGHQSRLYILEERRYDVEENLLRLTVNGRNLQPVHLVDGVKNFQLRAAFLDGTLQDSLGAADVWSNLRAVEVELHAEGNNRNRVVQRTWSSRITPRNVLSR